MSDTVGLLVRAIVALSAVARVLMNEASFTNATSVLLLTVEVRLPPLVVTMTSTAVPSRISVIWSDRTPGSAVRRAVRTASRSMEPSCRRCAIATSEEAGLARSNRSEAVPAN